MQGKVVDASVIGAWCFREPRSTEAVSLLRESELYAPVLLAYELTSIAKKKITAYPEKARLIELALQTALSVPIHWSEINYIEVLRLALDTNITTYDACYLYVARKAGLPLVTFDETLDKASRKGI